MIRPLKIFALAGLLALSTGGLTHLAAQITAPVSTGLTLSRPATIQTAAPNRVYVGKVTRTSFDGKVTTGDLLMSVTPGGEVNVNITTNGVVHPYFGQVAVADHSSKEALVKGKPRTGVIRALHQLAAVANDGTLLISTTELALTVTATSAHGEATYHNGSTLTFTAGRIGLAFATSGLPISISPGSGGAITVLPLTPGSGG